jgi:Icc-related predicted phosphoesterase
MTPEFTFIFGNYAKTCPRKQQSSKYLFRNMNQIRNVKISINTVTNYAGATPMGRFGREKKDEKKKKKLTRIFFATDIHGSERAFMKFVNAGKFYDVEALILGGDITGKMIVPIVERKDGGHSANYLGNIFQFSKEEEIVTFEGEVRNAGYYPTRLLQDEYDAVKDDDKAADNLFLKLMGDTVERWLKIAAERLQPEGIKMYITGGNDDDLRMNQFFQESEWAEYVEDKVVRIGEEYEMISSAYVNPTPWETPRETSEEKLAEKIEAMVAQLENVEKSIWNFHAPPYDSGLDVAPALDTSVYPPAPIMKSGELVYTNVGSKSVREAIDKYQPMLGLHGHIHEAKGIRHIGRTVCMNPGSEYSEAILRGIIINLDEKGVKSYQTTSG